MNGMTFRVGSVDYTVEQTPKLYHLYNLFGQVTYDDTHIQLEASMSQSRTNEVLVHELLHAIFYEAGFEEQDEDMINRVAKVLTQVLRDNDFNFIREEESE